MTITKKHLNQAMKIISNEYKPNKRFYITEDLLYKNGFPKQIDASRTIEMLIAMGYVDLDTSIDNYTLAAISKKGILYNEINNMERHNKRTAFIMYLITTGIAFAAFIVSLISMLYQLGLLSV